MTKYRLTDITKVVAGVEVWSSEKIVVALFCVAVLSLIGAVLSLIICFGFEVYHDFTVIKPLERACYVERDDDACNRINIYNNRLRLEQANDNE